MEGCLWWPGTGAWSAGQEPGARSFLSTGATPPFCTHTHTHTQVLPEAPRELVQELSARYVYLYERITGQEFQPPRLDEAVGARMERNIAPFL